MSRINWRRRTTVPNLLVAQMLGGGARGGSGGAENMSPQRPMPQGRYRKRTWMETGPDDEELDHYLQWRARCLGDEEVAEYLAHREWKNRKVAGGEGQGNGMEVPVEEP